MEQSSQHLIIVAGEASGDMHAAHLVDELKKIDPSLTFSGLGGPQMQQSGVTLYADLTQLAVVGFWEVLKHYREFKRIFHLLLQKVKETQTQTVVLVDYPGFNLRLAKELKRMGVRVIYYISPQIWAWKEKRVHEMKKYTDAVLVLFDFEKDFYAKHDVPVTFVGHPLMDTVQTHFSREDLLSRAEFDINKPTVGLMPGSRRREIEKLLPLMIEAAQRCLQSNPNLQFLLIKAPTIDQSLLENYLKKTHLPLKILAQNVYDGVQACDACMVASGTATLETAILGIPMVVVYKTSFLTWALAKLLVKIKNIGLVNVVAKKRIVPECIQYDATSDRISSEILNLMNNEPHRQQIKKDLTHVRDALGAPGASQRAAQEVIRHLSPQTDSLP